MIRTLLITIMLLLPGVAMAQTPANKRYEGQVNAPDFPRGMEWLNTERPLSLRELRGKIVLLDFWTYCCINCMHIIPELKRLEAKYADQLVVIGVHSAKFTNEKGTENIRQAILRYEIDHPVINDRDLEIWRQYAARGWPTLVLINPKGKILGQISGEGIYEVFDQFLGELIPYFRARGELDETPLRLRPERASALPSLLSFPGKVLADEPGDRLFISDSNHNRIIVTTLAGAVREVIGDGAAGRRDGSFAEAEFNHPQGLALDGESLYICDTENHLIRRADLRTRRVETLVGTGEQARRPNIPGTGTGVALNSPWDAVVAGGLLYVAMAGPHQIWAINPQTRAAVPYAGSGREEHIDGPLSAAALAQPSGITTDGRHLFFADSEVSSIRAAALPPGDRVSTIVGEGLFDFGDVDGPASRARLQHPLGVVYAGGRLYVADTYNHKIKEIDPVRRESRTFAGTRERGARDGDRRQAQFNEPGGLTATSRALYVADTNNHLIRRIELAGGQVATLELTGLEKLTQQAARRFRGRLYGASKQEIGPGPGVIALSFTLPPGFKFNQDAPFYIAVKTSDDRIARLGTPEVTKFPLEIPVEAAAGEALATIEAVIYFCNEGEQKLCLVDSVSIQLPLEVRAGAPRRATVEVAAKAKGLDR